MAACQFQTEQSNETYKYTIIEPGNNEDFNKRTTEYRVQNSHKKIQVLQNRDDTVVGQNEMMYCKKSTNQTANDRKQSGKSDGHK